MSGFDWRAEPEQAQEPEEVDWIEAEDSEQTLRRELQRLKRRAKKKPFLIIFLSLLGVAAVIRKVSNRVPMYQASVVLRVTEGNLVEEESPLANEGLANYLYSVALSLDRLKPIITKHNLYPQRATFGDLYAVDQLRDHLDIEVGANFFARARDEGDPQRTVAISVHFSDFDPELAFEVATDLSVALVEAEQERRVQHAERLSAIANTVVTKIEAKLSNLKAAMAEAIVTIDRGPVGPDGAFKVAEARIAQRRLAEDIKQTGLALESLSRDRDYTNLALEAEGAKQALRFEVVDIRRPVIQRKTSKVFFAILGLFVFVCLVPIVAIGIGAMDSRLHSIEDLLRLRMPVVGHVPQFPSDRMGSLRHRSRKAKDVA